MGTSGDHSHGDRGQIQCEVEFHFQVVNVAEGHRGRTRRKTRGLEAKLFHVQAHPTVAKENCLQETPHSSYEINCTISRLDLCPHLEEWKTTKINKGMD